MEPLSVVVFKYLLCFAAMLANSYLVYALHKLKKLSLVSYRFVLYLSISDILMGFLGIITNSLSLAHAKIFDSKHPLHEFYQWVATFQIFCINFSLVCILIIAVDRLIHMRYMTRYNSIMTKRRGLIIIMINVIFTTHTVTVIKLLPLYELDYLWKHVTAYRTYRVILSFIYIGLIVSIFFIYLWAYRAIKKRVESLVSFKPVNTAAGSRASRIEKNDANTRNRRRSPDQEFAKGMMYITLSLLLCVVPNLCCTVTIRILKMNGDKETFERAKTFVFHLQRWSYLALLLNPTLNAIILIICSGELRAYTKQFFFCCFRRHDRPDAQSKKDSSQAATEL
eukprot:Seg796.10 transcript_id=Seg796.10/GoldUCD/mRNA.D3Y31 product="Beta-2 adrenergic receptor" protein_id=Seg796.10/GoldUCD/D3Y31